MGSFHWLHFSDLHLTPEERFDTKYARSQLSDFLRTETSAGHLPCDYIFFTGDIAHKGNYDGVLDNIQKLLDSLGWDKYERVFWSVGNHDIPRDSKLRALIINHIRSNENETGLFEEFMDDSEIRDVLFLKGMKDYHQCHKKVLKREAFDIDSPAPHNQYLLPDLNLIVLNTCLTSCDNNDEHNLYIKESGLLSAFEDLNPINPTFVIGHHGIEYFKESEQRGIGHSFDSSNVDIYLCGHSHWFGHAVIPGPHREIHQITCGVGLDAKYSKFSFLYGYYNQNDRSVLIEPYSYEGNGSKNWHFDSNLHRKLDGNTTLQLTGDRTKSLPIQAPVRQKFDSESGGESTQKKQLEWSSGYFGFDDKQR